MYIGVVFSRSISLDSVCYLSLITILIVFFMFYFTVSCTATAGRRRSRRGRSLGIRGGQIEAFAHVERQRKDRIDRLELRLVAEQRQAGDAWESQGDMIAEKGGR